MKKKYIIFIGMCLFLFACSEDKPFEGNVELKNYTLKGKFDLGIIQGEENSDNLTKATGDPLEEYPYDQLYLYNPRTGEYIDFDLGSQTYGETDFTFIVTGTSNSDLLIKVGNIGSLEVTSTDNLYFVSQLNQYPGLSFKGEKTPNGNNAYSVFGPHLYRSANFNARISDGEIKLVSSTSSIIIENGVATVTVYRCTGYFIPKIVFFNLNGVSNIVPVEDWNTYFDNNPDWSLDNWEISSYLTNYPIFFDLTHNFSGIYKEETSMGNILLTKSSPITRVTGFKFYIGPGNYTDGINTYKSEWIPPTGQESNLDLYPYIYNGSLENKDVVFMIENSTHKFLARLNMVGVSVAANDMKSLYVYINIADLNDTGNAITKSLRSSTFMGENVTEIPVAFYEWK